MKNYISKMKGGAKSPPKVGSIEIIWSWVGAFLGITAVAFINYNILEGTDLVMVIGSFGASAVLIYGAINSPLAQPRNLIGGYFVSAIIGVASYQMLHAHMWLAASVAVATTIAVMHATGKNPASSRWGYGPDCSYRKPGDSCPGLPLLDYSGWSWCNHYAGGNTTDKQYTQE